jgi:protein dithiol:quinone oxidoreductase
VRERNDGGAFLSAVTVQAVSSRAGYAAGVLVCIGLLAFALYLQYVELQEPCPLCILQRIAFFAMMAVFVVAAVHGPTRRAAFIYSTIAFVCATAGAAVAARQVWLQHLPADRVPACGPGLEYMLERFPLSQVLGKVLQGSGECAEVGWTFLGLSIAGWSLVWFVLLGVFAMVIAARAPRLRDA